MLKGAFERSAHAVTSSHMYVHNHICTYTTTLCARMKINCDCVRNAVRSCVHSILPPAAAAAAAFNAAVTPHRCYCCYCYCCHN
eukprot:4400-Heterococcus_DN1.PRE.1